MKEKASHKKKVQIVGQVLADFLDFSGDGSESEDSDSASDGEVVEASFEVGMNKPTGLFSEGKRKSDGLLVGKEALKSVMTSAERKDVIPLAVSGQSDLKEAFGHP